MKEPIKLTNKKITFIPFNVTMTSADTEYTLTLSHVNELMIQCRTANDVRMAFVTGKVATPTEPYFTIKAGGGISFENINWVSVTLYFACSSAGKTVEILKI
ncbi:MAG: hypothetical protein SV062_08015 [Thermodesulfobacteriota bacterium]|nr:hypothetical protein [Thermodesulfobacteriota bacterium]